MLEQMMPYLARPPTDKEWTLAVDFLGYWASKPGLCDDEAEIAMAIALSMYIEHRRLMGDSDAESRLAENIRRAKQWKRHELVTGDDAKRRILCEYEAGRRRLKTKEEKLDEQMSAGGWSDE